jgi:hypothetical protein
MNNFQLYSKYYDLLYNDKDYKSESEYVYNSLNKLLKPKQKHIPPCTDLLKPSMEKISSLKTTVIV